MSRNKISFNLTKIQSNLKKKYFQPKLISLKYKNKLLLKFLGPSDKPNQSIIIRKQEDNRYKFVNNLYRKITIKLWHKDRSSQPYMRCLTR